MVAWMLGWQKGRVKLTELEGMMGHGYLIEMWDENLRWRRRGRNSVCRKTAIDGFEVWVLAWGVWRSFAVWTTKVTMGQGHLLDSLGTQKGVIVKVAYCYWHQTPAQFLLSGQKVCLRMTAREDHLQESLPFVA